MRSTNLSVAAVVLVLSACASLGLWGLKPPPDVDTCAMVWNGTLDASYAYCRSVDPTKNRTYRKPADLVFKEKMIGMSARHESDMQKYIEYLEVEAKKRCD